MEGISIYALLHDSGGIRYIGRAIDPEARLQRHWRECGIEKFWYRPVNLWLRSRPEIPRMRILAVVEPEASRREDIPFIIAARAAFPGKLTNLRPLLADDAPEWDLFKRLAAADDPDFDYATFLAQLREANKAMLAAKAKAQWADPEHRKRMAESNKSRWDDPEYRAKMKAAWTPERRTLSLAALKAKWQDPAFRAEQSVLMTERNRAMWSDPELSARLAERLRNRPRGRDGRALPD